MTLMEGFVKDEVFIDFGCEVMYGSDQAYISYPCRFPTVEFQLMATNGLSQIADRIRKDDGFKPMHAMDEYTDDTCDNEGWYDFFNAKLAVDANPGYAAFDGSGKQVYPKAENTFSAYRVSVSIPDLNYRKGPSTSYESYGYIEPGIYTIVDEEDGWGLLEAYAANRNGWISLAYAARI